MTPIEVVLPKVDMDMESGIIAVWKVAEGDFVREGDVLFEMETDKAVMEVESPGTGTIRALASITGQPVAVGTPVAWIHGAAAAEGTGRDPTAPAPEIAAAAKPAGPVITPRAAAPDAGVDRSGVRATPLARRTARLRDVELTDVSGSGPRGRIVAQDVEAHAESRIDAPSAAATRIARDATDPPRPGAKDGEDGPLVPFNPVRRIVAQRLAESARSAPHFYLTAQIEMTALLAAMRRLGPVIAKAANVKPSFTVMLARIVGQVLPHHPLVNASIEGDAARMHPHVHIGIAMDRDGDLVVPVLRDAHARPLAELATEYGRLRDAVRARTIAPSEMRGGTFTMSNLGMHEVDAFTAIVNQPESAILAIGRVVDTPVGRDGQIVLRPMATLSLSSDHRIVDGVTAARFMAHLRRAIEDPDAML